MVLFFSKNDVCSNFYPCGIIYDNKKFFCSEQLFMYLKAITFKDYTMANNILFCKTPQQAKQFGRMVKNYKDKIWDNERDDCMFYALVAKFNSCIEFRNFILKHKDKIFAEASPYDKIWGIGLPETDPRATDPNQWLGENRLGKCLNRLVKVMQDSDNEQNNG